MKKFNVLFYISFLLVLAFFDAIFSTEALESPEPVEDVNYKVVKILNKITEDTVIPLEKTKGFNYRYGTKWFSPYRFEVYVGKFTKKLGDSIIRVEAPRKGEARIVKMAIEQELFNEKIDPSELNKQIRYKSHLLNQSFNFISPAFGIAHAGFRSPFYTNDEMLIKMAIYVLIDVAIVGLVAAYAQNTTRSRRVFDNFGQTESPPSRVDLVNGPLAGLLFGMLLIPRTIRGFDGYNDIATQNRFAELGYTFRF
ncbi:MAG: hypothetical protein SFU98_20920 [Leptospiraceae bacterium]|nr:hypothetical protein [Leptospiraceae bacterium]